MVSVSVRYLFYQPRGEKIKTWTLRFPAKGNHTCNMDKALFDLPIVLQYDVNPRALIGQDLWCIRVKTMEMT